MKTLVEKSEQNKESKRDIILLHLQNRLDSLNSWKLQLEDCKGNKKLESIYARLMRRTNKSINRLLTSLCEIYKGI